MRHLAILLLSFITFNSIGQITPKWLDNSKHQANLHDSIPKVIYTNEHKHGGDAAFFINDQFVSEEVVTTINLELIEKLDVIKKTIEIKGRIYNSQILLTMKSDYLPKLISLTNLKSKYTNLNQQVALFLLDGKIVNADYDDFVVDESNILSITVEKADKVKGNSDMNLIKLLTRTPENIAKSKQIRIRGANLASSF